MISREQFDCHVVELQKKLFLEGFHGDFQEMISNCEDKELLDKFKAIATPENIPHIKQKLSLNINFNARKFYEFSLNFASRMQ